MNISITNKKGITLIALVITIIILLILAGITISSLIDSGLFGNAKKSREISEKAQIQEEIELAIMEIQIDETGKGKDVTLETLVNGQLIDKLNEITAELNNSKDEILGEYKGYDYTINDKFKVIIGDKVSGINFKYTLNPTGYTNQDIILSVVATSENGGITIENPSNLIKNEDGTYTITKNGSYEFIVTDSIGEKKRKTININKIDKLIPENFTPSIEENENSFKIISNAKDTEETDEYACSGIDKYKYYVNGQCFESSEDIYILENINIDQEYEIYVVVYDKAGNEKISETIRRIPEITDINLSYDNNSLDIGGNKIITVTLVPNISASKEIIWEVSDTNIATINNGVLTGKSKGNITVTAKLKNNPNITKTIEIIVNYPLLGAKAKEGEYVNYPVSYTNSVDYANNTASKTGWIVGKIASSSSVNIIAAGCPTNYTYNTSYTVSTNRSYINNLCANYLNRTYGVSARNVRRTDFTLETSVYVGMFCWLDELNPAGTGIYAASTSNTIPFYSSGFKFGVRPVIALKTNMRTSGQVNGIWQLVIE